MPWDLVERAAPDLLSFDLAPRRARPVRCVALERLLARGGHALARVAAAGDQSLLTAPCGTGRMSHRREDEVAAALAAVAARRRAATPSPPRGRFTHGVTPLRGPTVPGS